MKVFKKIIFLVFKTPVELQTMIFWSSNAFSIRETSSTASGLNCAALLLCTAHNTKDEHQDEDNIWEKLSCDEGSNCYFIKLSQQYEAKAVFWDLHITEVWEALKEQSSSVSMNDVYERLSVMADQTNTCCYSPYYKSWQQCDSM